MGMISRTLEHVRPHGAGVWVQEHMVDHLGRDWYHRYVIRTEANAQTAMDARDMVPQLEDQERLDARRAANVGTDLTTLFPPVDITALDMDAYLAVLFNESEIDHRQTLVNTLGVYISDELTIAQLAAALGTSEARAQPVLDRAETIRDTIKPVLDADRTRTRA